MSILPLNLILQIILLPVYLLVLIGSEVTMDVVSLLGSVAMVLVIPFVLSCLTKAMTGNRPVFQDFLAKQGDNLQHYILIFYEKGKLPLDFMEKY